VRGRVRVGFGSTSIVEMNIVTCFHVFHAGIQCHLIVLTCICRLISFHLVNLVQIFKILLGIVSVARFIKFLLCQEAIVSSDTAT